MTISIKPTASGSTIEQDGSTVLSVESDRSVDIDSGTLHVDATNNRVGIGTASPAELLELTANNDASLGVARNKLLFHDTDSAIATGQSAGTIEWTQDGGSLGAGTIGRLECIAEGTGGSYSMRFYTGNVTNFSEKMRIDSNGVVTKPYHPAFVATNNSGTHTTNTSSTFDFNVEKFDKGNNYNPSTYRFTAPVAGAYYFNFHIYEQNGASVKSIAYKVNGSIFGFQDTAIGYQGAVNVNQSTIDCPIIIDLAANDYVEVAVRNVAAANLTWYGGHSWFMGYLIG